MSPDAERARALLGVLAAAPRPAGGAEETQVRAHCARLLADAGFSVREEQFSYSSVPGRLATPVGGMASIALLGLAGHLGTRGHADWALGTLAFGATTIGALALWVGRRGVLDIPWGRSRSVNLVATRPAPRVWLVAHLDSKSQPVPIVVRALGVMGCIIVWLSAVGLAAAQLGGAEVAFLWPWLAGAGAAAGLPVAASVTGARSAGAIDDASGVAAVLLAAQQVQATCPIAVLLTSAEELGLAGARAWARDHEPGTAINVDGVDDEGDVRLTFSGRRPSRLIDILSRTARGAEVPARAGRLLPGVLLDGVALADAGWEVLTISRGTFGTVARIHTGRDTVASLDGTGVAVVASLIARALEELT